MSVQKWDVIAAELTDTKQAERNRHKAPAQPCPYCGTVTRREDGTCYAHRDLVRIDPNLTTART